MLTSRGLGTVLGDLASMGFDAEWGVLSAADVGANHTRERIWIVGKVSNANSRNGDRWAKSRKGGASGVRLYGPQKQMADSTNARQLRAQLVESNSRSERRRQSQTYFDKKSEIHGKKMAHTDSAHGERNEFTKRGVEKRAFYCESSWWSTEPNVGRVANGVAARVDRLKAIGNGQVPLCAATAFKLLKERLK